MSLHRSLIPLAVLIAASAVGCGGAGDQPELGIVTGVLSDKGRPVPGATVEFYPEKGRPSFATTADDGSFAAQYGPEQPGAVVGKHKIQVTYSGNPPAANAAAGEEPILTPMKTVAMPGPIEIAPGENKVDLDLAKAVRS